MQGTDSSGSCCTTRRGHATAEASQLCTSVCESVTKGCIIAIPGACASATKFKVKTKPAAVRWAVVRHSTLSEACSCTSDGCKPLGFELSIVSFKGSWNSLRRRAPADQVAIPRFQSELMTVTSSTSQGSHTRRPNLWLLAHNPFTPPLLQGLTR